MHTHHIPTQNHNNNIGSSTRPRRSRPLGSARKRAALAGAMLTSVASFAAFSTPASASEFYPVPTDSFASLCNGTVGYDEITMNNSGNDNAHFTIQWTVGGQSGTDSFDVAPGAPVSKKYFPPEGSYSDYQIDAPGQPVWWSHAQSYTDCTPSPIGTITLVCPTDGSSAYLLYQYSNISTKSANFDFGIPGGLSASATLDASSGQKSEEVAVAEDTSVSAFIKADGVTLASFSQLVDCVQPIPTTTTIIPETTIPDTTIPVTVPPTIPQVVATVPVETAPATTVPPMVQQLPPTVASTVPHATLPATGRSSGNTAVLAGGLLLLGAGCIVITRRRRNCAGS